jgi:cell division protein DivIC
MGSIFKLLQDSIVLYTKIPARYINKYSIVGFVFFIWVGFLDTHSFWDAFQLKRTISKYEQEKIDLAKNIEIAKADKKDLENNKEKFAREKFFMHKENEEVFIIERKK